MPAAAVRAVRGCSLLRRNFPSILMVPMLLKNQVALITGSGRGIGRAIAHLFAKEGASAFLTARTEKELGAVAKEIAENGGRAEYAMADLTQEAACTRVVAAVREKFGGDRSEERRVGKGGRGRVLWVV